MLKPAIRILPPTLINRIAAGEVIERPSSAVKELVENSLDAGASDIDIILEQGGKNRIMVTDNGKGMSPQELVLAVQRHATSKLPEDDLFDIKFLGFRGEALPSIGSVSRMSITSRTAGSDNAWRIAVIGGDMEEPVPATLPCGTSIQVKDLFYATPARLKFLKTDRTETGQSLDMIKRLAMAHPLVSFSLTSDGKTIFKVNSVKNSLERLRDVMGKEFAENSLPLDYERGNARLSGFAALPTFNRGTSLEQYLFVNGRPVKDRLLIGAVKAAYQDVLAHDRYPVVALFIDISGSDVDVNVHPAKAEVRFRDNQSIRGMIISAIRNSIAGAGFRSANTASIQALKSFSANNNIGNNNGNDGSFIYDGLRSVSQVQQHAFSERAYHGKFEEAAACVFEAQPASFPYESLVPREMLPPLARSSETETVFRENENDRTPYPLGAARCQLHKTYIVAETDDGLVIVDQHAAHERLVLEQMKNSLNEKGISRQSLLIPEIVHLDEDMTETLLSRREELLEFGFSIERFGSRTILVRETPAMLGEINAALLIKELADNIREYGETIALKEKIDQLSGTIACHGSVRAGRSLNIAEMNSLLRQMEKTPLSGQCNHGRPTYIELKRKDIEVLFGRR